MYNNHLFKYSIRKIVMFLIKPNDVDMLIFNNVNNSIFNRIISIHPKYMYSTRVKNDVLGVLNG